MTDDINEQISALLDNELGEREIRHALDALEGDESLRDKWDRYNLIGDAMRGEAVRLSADSIADRVRAKLEQQPETAPAFHPIPFGRPVRLSSRWYKSAGGAALAASVAVITVLAFPQLTNMSSEPGGQVVVERAVPDAAPYLTRSSTHWKNLSEPKVESKLNRYLIDHNEFAAPGGIGVIPYANFVSYDSNR
ncbi:sigma-E factor negative regulatory protein [Sedimenticola sp.]|uniref:sigma-E factor negative regulatory protein n=1 Tax=Sedimenticola sp. TaxID=1940285 RepID=UPI003D0E0E74